MPPSMTHETSVRAVVPHEKHGDLILCGLPGLRVSLEGMAYFDPEHAELTFEYLASAGVSLLYLFMEDMELPPKSRGLIDELGHTHKIKIEWIPIVDYGTPGEASEELWKAGRSERFDVLKAGDAIAVSCIYGAGRCGMMAAAISAEMGVEVQKSVIHVRKYFVEAVGSLEQERWVAKGSYLT